MEVNSYHQLFLDTMTHVHARTHTHTHTQTHTHSCMHAHGHMNANTGANQNGLVMLVCLFVQVIQCLAHANTGIVTHFYYLYTN